MKVAGRHDEKKILDWQHERDDSQFVAIYGRRRVGKTFLIRHHYANEIAFSCTGLKDVSKQDQLEHFYKEILLQTRIKSPPPRNWMEAFTILEQHLSNVKSKKNRKKVLFAEKPKPPNLYLQP